MGRVSEIIPPCTTKSAKAFSWCMRNAIPIVQPLRVNSCSIAWRIACSASLGDKPAPGLSDGVKVEDNILLVLMRQRGGRTLS